MLRFSAALATPRHGQAPGGLRPAALPGGRGLPRPHRRDRAGRARCALTSVTSSANPWTSASGSAPHAPTASRCSRSSTGAGAAWRSSRSGAPRSPRSWCAPRPPRSNDWQGRTAGGPRGAPADPPRHLGGRHAGRDDRARDLLPAAAQPAVRPPARGDGAVPCCVRRGLPPARRDAAVGADDHRPGVPGDSRGSATPRRRSRSWVARSDRWRSVPGTATGRRGT